MKSLSRSETISKGKPFSQYHLWKNISASCSAVSVETVGMIWMSDPSRSVKVIIVSNPESLGSGPMKSIATESQRASGIGSGWRGPVGRVVLDLFR